MSRVEAARPALTGPQAETPWALEETAWNAPMPADTDLDKRVTRGNFKHMCRVMSKEVCPLQSMEDSISSTTESKGMRQKSKDQGQNSLGRKRLRTAPDKVGPDTAPYLIPQCKGAHHCRQECIDMQSSF
jgi:hypothetical protein